MIGAGPLFRATFLRPGGVPGSAVTQPAPEHGACVVLMVIRVCDSHRHDHERSFTRGAGVGTVVTSWIGPDGPICFDTGAGSGTDQEPGRKAG